MRTSHVGGQLRYSSASVMTRSNDSHFGGARELVLEMNYGVYLAELDKRTVPLLMKGAAIVARAAQMFEDRVKTGELRQSIKPGEVQRNSRNNVFVTVVADKFYGLFQNSGTLGHYNRSLSSSHRQHIRRAGGLTAKRIASKKGKRGGSRWVWEQTGKARVRQRKLNADGSVNRKYKRTTYKRTTNHVTKKGNTRVTKHGIKPLKFMEHGLEAGYPRALEVMQAEIAPESVGL